MIGRPARVNQRSRQRRLWPAAVAAMAAASLLAPSSLWARQPAIEATTPEDRTPQTSEPSNPADIRPTTSPAPGRALLREGAFLADQPGEMRRLRTGGWVFVIQGEDQDAPPGPALALLPCQTLTEMEQVASAAPKQTTMRVSGQVFVYRGRNYFLPTVFTLQAARPSEKPEAPPSEEPADQPAPETLDDPTVEELIASLEAGDGEEDAGAPWIPPPTQARSGLRRDGSYLRRRRGRLQREASGVLVFTLESDADVEAGTDPPLVLLPSLALMEIEALLERSSAELAFTISGRVFAYEGANYLLPSVFQAHRRSGEGITSAQ